MRGQTARRWATRAMSPPSTFTVPFWIWRTPAMIASSVDFPTPSGPKKPTMHPDGTTRFTASKATVSP